MITDFDLLGVFNSLWGMFSNIMEVPSISRPYDGLQWTSRAVIPE